MTLRQVTLPGAGAEPDGGWVRPADWLTLPVLTAGQQKCVGLVAIFPGDSNFVTVHAVGAYTVDWGDGSAPENGASNTTKVHNYAWASVPGTNTTEGYRQAIVTITPQAGQTITSYLFGSVIITGVPSSSTLWLDVAIVGASVTNASFNATRHSSMLQQFTYVGPAAITSAASMFSGCRSLRSIVGTEWFEGVTNTTNMFQNCLSLIAADVPLFDTSAVTTFTGMFIGCTALEAIPLLNTSAGTNFASMFSGCTILKNIPLLNTSAGTTFSNMFFNCPSLKAIPLLNTPAGTNFDSMFSACSALQSVPALIVSAGTSFASMFASTSGLQSSALVGTSKTISYASCKLSAAQLDAIYTALASGVTAQTITVTGNWGAAAATPSIATAKGWSVVA